MYNPFDGEFRRQPKFKVRGFHKGESKEELIERARQERKKREVARTQQASTVKIQAFFRGCLARQRLKNELRRQFDTVSGVSLERSAAQLLLFFNPAVDGERIRWLCQAFVTQRVPVLEEVTKCQKIEIDWPLRIGRLLKASLDFMARASGQEKIAHPMRFVEIYSTPETYTSQRVDLVVVIYKYLMEQNYFDLVRVLCDARIPPLLEETVKPPTPMADAILAMILRPLSILDSHSIHANIKEMAMINVSNSFFSRSLSEQVELFILPALANSDFPYVIYLGVLAKCCRKITKEGLLSSACLLFSTLRLGKGKTSALSSNETVFLNYLDILSELTKPLSEIKGVYGRFGTLSEDQDFDDCSDSEESEDGGEKVDISEVTNEGKRIVKDAFEMLNDKELSRQIMRLAVEQTDGLALKSLCRLCHQLLIVHPFALHNFRLLYTLAFRPAFVHRLWDLVLETKRPALFGTAAVPLLAVISRGIRITTSEMDEIVPVLAVFVALFGYLLVTIHDTEFFGESAQTKDYSESQFASRSSGRTSTATNLRPTSGTAFAVHQMHKNSVWMPFTLTELVPMSLALRDVTIGLIEFAFPESRPVVREDYKLAVGPVRSDATDGDGQQLSNARVWTHLFRATVLLVRQLYTRDTRRQFCPDNHWISDRIILPLDRTNDLSLRRTRLRQYRPFQGLRVFTREELVEEGPPLSAKEVRLATVLREMPYAVSFNQRVHVFQSLVQRDKSQHQGDAVNFLQGKQIQAHIRRNFIYEDAFEKLSQTNEPELRLKMRIQLVNAAGMDEAGIDGGGLFREFVTELVKTSFDPNRGFFRLTMDQQLYPNPNVQTIEPNYVPHYYFIGRILGKALYENMLIELPLAGFFLSKLLGQKSVNVDIDHLSSLDPELYKNLLYLKNCEGDVKDLNLDFTMVSEEVGTTQVEDLKPNGSSVVVTNENRIEYIHLVADYKLNRQIKSQCSAFRHGLSDVINLDWLRMFSHKELQFLISGADHEIDLQELRKCTNYGNGYDDDHPTIQSFWTVCSEMSEEQKRKLLKFVTSCSRPPLLGFKELDPPFGIQNAGNDPDRLPTASTCMNLLKLPDFKDEFTLRTKLLYAIEAAAGFELS